MVERRAACDAFLQHLLDHVRQLHALERVCKASRHTFQAVETQDRSRQNGKTSIRTRTKQPAVHALPRYPLVPATRIRRLRSMIKR